MLVTLQSLLLIVLLQFNLFLSTHSRFQVDGELKYLSDAQDLIRPERNTLFVSFEDIETANQELAAAIIEDYYRYCIRCSIVTDHITLTVY